MTLPKTFKVLEGLVLGTFVLGNSVSLADFQVFDFITNMIKTAFPTFELELKAFPKLASIVASVGELPVIAAYLKN